MTDSREPGYLDDHQGNPSSIRAMSVVALIAAIAFGLITILQKVENADSADSNGLYITTAFLLAAFAPKAVQKFAESRFPKDSD